MPSTVTVTAAMLAYGDPPRRLTPAECWAGGVEGPGRGRPAARLLDDQGAVPVAEHPPYVGRAWAAIRARRSGRWPAAVATTVLSPRRTSIGSSIHSGTRLAPDPMATIWRPSSSKRSAVSWSCSTGPHPAAGRTPRRWSRQPCPRRTPGPGPAARARSRSPPSRCRRLSIEALPPRAVSAGLVAVVQRRGEPVEDGLDLAWCGRSRSRSVSAGRCSPRGSSR